MRAARPVALTGAVAMQAVCAAGVLVVCPPLRAQSTTPEPPWGFSGRIGAVVAGMPTYEGSARRRTLAAPDLTLNYRSHDWGSVEFSARGLVWNAVEAGRFRVALAAQFDPGRRDRDSTVLDPTPGDRRLAGMGRLASSVEAGLGLGYGPLMVVARQSLRERGPQGAQVDFSAGWPWALSERLTLQFNVSATWADRDEMQARFGVTPGQAQASGFAAYTPPSGCRKVEASIGAAYQWMSGWALQASLGAVQLGDPAAASPVVARRDSTTATLGISHAF